MDADFRQPTNTGKVPTFAETQELMRQETARKALIEAQEREKKAELDRLALIKKNKDAFEAENRNVTPFTMPGENEGNKLGMAANLPIQEKIKDTNALLQASGVKPQSNIMGNIDTARKEQTAFRQPVSAKTPDPQELARLKNPTTSATELANAPPSQAKAVIDKLKEEEKRGGPNFFDIIEAAAAGWNGNVPAYIKKALAQKEQEQALERMQVQADTQAQQEAENRAFQTAQFNEEMALKERIAGLNPASGLGARLSVPGFLGGK